MVSGSDDGAEDRLVVPKDRLEPFYAAPLTGGAVRPINDLWEADAFFAICMEGVCVMVATDGAPGFEKEDVERLFARFGKTLEEREAFVRTQLDVGGAEALLVVALHAFRAPVDFHEATVWLHGPTRSREFNVVTVPKWSPKRVAIVATRALHEWRDRREWYDRDGFRLFVAAASMFNDSKLR